MSTRKYNVRVNVGTFYDYEVDANDEETAMLKAESMAMQDHENGVKPTSQEPYFEAEIVDEPNADEEEEELE